MIRLNYNPCVGSSLSVNLSFRDQQGKYYVPLVVSYSLFALNSDKESWTVVGDYYKKALTPASLINLVIPNLEDLTGTTLQRKVLVYWKTTLNGELTDFIDEVSFELKSLPTLINPPPEPEPTPIYVKVTDVEIQNGSSVSAPVNPVIKVTVNLPVITEGASIVFNYNETETPSVVQLDATKTILTIYPEVSLENSTNYKLKINGLVSSISSYEMEEPFEYGFTTVPAGSVTPEELQQEIDTISSHVETIAASIETITSNIETITGQLETVTSNIETINGQIETITGNIENINSRVETATSNIETINSQIETISGNVETMSGQIETINTNIETINGQITNLDERVTALEG